LGISFSAAFLNPLAEPYSEEDLGAAAKAIENELGIPVLTPRDVGSRQLQIAGYSGKEIAINVLDVASLGHPLIAFHIRTAPYPPILLGTALYALYITDPRHRHLVLQSPRYTDLNISRILLSARPRASLFLGTKIFGCDGPVYSCVDTIEEGFQLLGDPIAVDRFVYAWLRSSCRAPRLRYVEILARTPHSLDMVAMGRLGTFVKRVKLHNLYPSIARYLKYANRGLSAS